MQSFASLVRYEHVPLIVTLAYYISLSVSLCDITEQARVWSQLFLLPLSFILPHHVSTKQTPAAFIISINFGMNVYHDIHNDFLLGLPSHHEFPPPPPQTLDKLTTHR